MVSGHAKMEDLGGPAIYGNPHFWGNRWVDPVVKNLSILFFVPVDWGDPTLSDDDQSPVDYGFLCTLTIVKLEL